MKIVNPLYDYAFKYLMQNNRIAKKVISTLLECEVLELNVEQQEIIALDKVRGLKLYRLDFSANIINDRGEKQKVLIELQKSKLPTNTLRFRTYLGESYTKKEVVKDESGEQKTKIYPIISIYILGYNVVDIPYLAVSVDNRITNTVTKKEISVNSNFIDLLTHKTRIIQIRRLSEKRRTRLEQFLLLFNQAWTTPEGYILELEEIPDEFKDIADYLGSPVNNEDFRNQLKGEAEIDAIFQEHETALAEAKQKEVEARHKVQEAKQKEQEAKQKEQEAKQKEQEAKLRAQEARQREQEARLKEQEARLKEQEAKLKEQEAKQREMEALQQQRQLQIQFAKHLLSTGIAVDKVMQMTGLSKEIVIGLQ